MVLMTVTWFFIMRIVHAKARTLYVVTDGRAIIAYGMQPNRVESILPENFVPITIERTGLGRGTLHFAECIVHSHDENWTKHYIFRDIPDVEHVATLLHALAAPKGPAGVRQTDRSPRA